MPLHTQHLPHLFELGTSRGPLWVPVQLQRKPSLRYMRIVVDPNHTVIVKVPSRIGDGEAFHFLRTNGDWVAETMRRQPRRRDLWQYLRDAPSVTLAAQRHSLNFYLHSAPPEWRIHAARRCVDLTFNTRSCRETQLRWLLRALAAHDLPVVVANLARSCRVRVHGVVVRDQRSRWGSCSETGGLSLNWRLVLLPPPIQRHIILHELAHLTHFDHSPAFHNLLQRYDPASQRHALDLDQWSRILMPLGRQAGGSGGQ
jgi:predicted metal-dependent hydrolase